MGEIRKICAEPEYLRVVVTGSFTLDDAKRNFSRMLESVARYQAEKILIDGREVKGNPKAIERFLYGEFAAKSVARQIAEERIPRACRFAYVMLEPVLDPNRLGETVAVNRGMWVKAFDDLDAAFAWLEVAPPPRPNEKRPN